jgi:hypothetical protein
VLFIHPTNINLFYKETNYIFALQFKATYLLKDIVRDRAGVARWAHNPKVVGSNPSPATNKNPLAKLKGFYFVPKPKLAKHLNYKMIFVSHV